MVTLAPNLTELIVFCGCEDLLVGTDEFSNYPPSIQSLPKVGGLQPSLERLAQLEPDIVLASTSGNQASLSGSLERLGIAFYAVRTERLADIPRSAERLASMVCGRNAARQAGDLREQLESQRRQRARVPRILFLVWPDPLYVAGRQTFIDDLIVLAGGQNGVAADVQGWPQYSLEAVVANPPDMIIYPSASVRAAELESLFERDRRWASLPVVKKKFYLAVDEDLFTRPGPRVAKAAEALNRLIDQWEQQTQ